MAINMCKGCGTMKAYMDGVCKGCHSLRDSNLFKEDEGVKKAESSSSETGSETTSEHGEQEVRMSLQQLHSVCGAATKLKGHVKKETLVPAWVQSLLTVAHENLEHIEGYFEGKHMKKGGDFAIPTPSAQKPRMPVPTRGMKKPPTPSKGMTAGRNIALSETAQEADVENINKGDTHADQPAYLLAHHGAAQTGKAPAGQIRCTKKECHTAPLKHKTGGRIPATEVKKQRVHAEDVHGWYGPMGTECTHCGVKIGGAEGMRAYHRTGSSRSPAAGEMSLDQASRIRRKHEEKVSKSDVPTFPRVTGDSRVLLQHISPDQTVVQQITGRDTHQPHSYNLAPSNWENGAGLRRR